MTIKTKQYSTGKLVVLAISLYMLFAFTGCEKDADTKNAQNTYEIDQDYERGPLTVHVRVDKKSITIADTVMLEFEAAVDPNYEVVMPNLGPELVNFGIVDWKSLGDKLDENNNIVSISQYRLEPFLSGTYSIPAFTFEFFDANDSDDNKHKLTTDPIEIEIQSLLGEQRDELKIADIENVIEMPQKKSYAWVWMLSIILVIGIATGVVIYLRSKRVKELVRIYKPAHEIAYERLRMLVQQNLIEAGKIKEFYEGISDILRHYIEHRFDLRAPERTTDEFLIELQYTNVLSDSDKESLGEFLKHCDMVKFAKYDPTEEQIQKTFDLVKKFIEKTKSQEKKVDVTETQTQEFIEIGS